MIYNDDATFIIEALETLGWSQSVLAEKAGVSRTFVNAVVHGRRPASAKVINALADAGVARPMKVTTVVADGGATVYSATPSDAAASLARTTALARTIIQEIDGFSPHVNLIDLMLQVVNTGGRTAEREVMAFLRGMQSAYRAKAD